MAAAAQPCLAIGYDGPGLLGLRHPEAEARWIADLTGGEAWCGPQAKADDLQQTAGQWRWLHIACHGLFDEESPLDSYLETGAGERLTAREVLQTWRLQASLVALSACQTGVSRVLRSDEPMGLVRAFLVAGAANVLVSQWPVADLPAFLLMRAVYEGMAGGERPAAALQAAQIWLRELPVEEVRAMAAELPAADLDNLAAYPFAHPVHWAAFILVGRV
jgi:CHAT domain-containing protein